MGDAVTSIMFSLMALLDADVGNETMRFAVAASTDYTVNSSSSAVDIA